MHINMTGTVMLTSVLGVVNPKQQINDKKSTVDLLTWNNKMKHNNQMKNNNHTTAYTDTDSLDSPTTEQDDIYEIQHYFDQPLKSDNCCGNQAHLFMLEKLSWGN